MAEDGPTSLKNGTRDVLIDGVVDTYEGMAAFHDGAAPTRTGNTLELTRFEDMVAVTKRRDVHSMDPDTAVFVSLALGAGRPLIPLMLDGESPHQIPQAAGPALRPEAGRPDSSQSSGPGGTLIDSFAADGSVDFSRHSASHFPARSS